VGLTPGRREAACLLPTVTASEEKNVFVNLDGQILLNFTSTTPPLPVGHFAQPSNTSIRTADYKAISGILRTWVIRRSYGRQCVGA
jgi:hypothetical protein